MADCNLCNDTGYFLLSQPDSRFDPEICAACKGRDLPTSLYRCDGCGNIIRFVQGRTSLKHVHYDAEGEYLGKDAEGRYVEFADDGREEAEDPRDSRWYGLGRDPTVDEQITALAMDYYTLIGQDSHKDCDCHWYVKKRWSYGELVGYYVQHEGYCYEGMRYSGEGPFPTYALAAQALIVHLERAIALARAWHDTEGEIPPRLLR